MTAAICTRDREDRVPQAVRSVLACSGGDFDLLVIDQSAGDRTREALASVLSEDRRVRYVRTDTRGVSRSRNLALRLATGEVVAFTDDDCIVPPEWIARMREVFVRWQSVAVAFCNVAGAPHDPLAGFVPAYQREGTVLVSTFLAKCRARGIGAGMALRRSAALEFGGFDELLGPGGTLRSGEDYDIAVRAILAGYQVCETDAVEVVHFGFRTWDEGRYLTRRDWYGIGAAYSKPLRAGHLRFAVVPIYELLANVAWPLARDAAHLRRPRGLKRATSFAAGFFRGLRTPLEPRTLRFADDAPRRPGSREDEDPPAPSALAPEPGTQRRTETC